jgi:hypothetical protein
VQAQHQHNAHNTMVHTAEAGAPDRVGWGGQSWGHTSLIVTMNLTQHGESETVKADKSLILGCGPSSPTQHNPLQLLSHGQPTGVRG